MSKATSDFSSRILGPVGNYRAKYVTPSKGKRQRKRKRQETKISHINGTLDESDALPPMPEILSYLLIGLASITRHLELLSNATRARKPQEQTEANLTPDDCDTSTNLAHSGIAEVQHVAAIFVCRSSQQSVLHAHLPEMVATASLGNPHLPPTRLVQLPRDSENRLSSALCLPRASFVAILEGAPHSTPLLKLVRGTVPVVEVPWLKEAQSAQHKPVKINTILTTAPVTKKHQESN